MKDKDTLLLEQIYLEMSHELNVLWESGDYKIAVDSLEHPNFYTLWYENKRVGELSLASRITENKKSFQTVSYISIDPKHRGRRLGYRMYQVVLENLPDGVDGIVSYLPDRSNKRQIPKIYKRLGGYEDGDYAFILK